MPETSQKGDLRFEYEPLPVHPMGVALLIVFSTVALLGIPTIIRGASLPLVLLWLLPLAITATAAILDKPGPIKVFDNGLEVSLPLWRRVLRTEGFVPFSQIINVFPKAYYVAGATASPFAAAVGTVEHLGLGLETRGGRKYTLRFTPSLPGFVKGESEGYRLTLAHLRKALEALGRPMVLEVKSYRPSEVESMKLEVLRPLMSFPLITVAFFSPLVILSLGYLLLTVEGWTFHPLPLAVVVLTAILPILLVTGLTWRRSSRRHHLLDEISKLETNASQV